MRLCLFILPLALTLSSLTSPQAVNAGPQSKSVAEGNTPTASTNEHIKALTLNQAVLAFLPKAEVLQAENESEKTIRELHEQARRALAEGNIKVVARLWADDFIGIGPTGATRTKAELIELYRRGLARIESTEAIEPPQIRMYNNDTAMVMIHTRTKGRSGNKDISGEYRGLWVWAKRNGNWQIVSYQSALIPSQGGAAQQGASMTAQTKGPRVARLGLLSDYEKFGGSASPSDWLDSFHAGLRGLGYVEGENVLLESRYANRDPEKLARFAAELADMKVDVIVTASTTAAKAAKAATHTIPIVFWGAEPLSSGLVANLDHPGENLTGVTANEEEQKEFLAQLKEIVPGLDRVAILFNPSYAPVPGILKYAESGARELGLSPQPFEVTMPGDLPEAFAVMKRHGFRAVLVLNHRMFFEERARVAALAIENGIAVSTPYLPNGQAGALIAHENDFDQVWRMNAGYVDKILNGANPGDLPIQRLAAFRYAINLKTAKALGLRIPEPILKRAAIVIPDSASAPY